MTKKYDIGELIEVTVEKIVPNGLGLCFAEDLTVFVPLSARGDRLRAELRQIKGKTAFARIDTILDASGERAEPQCEYYGVCGGCDFQHLSYESQLQSKVGILRDCLKRIGKIDFDGEITIEKSSRQYGYRLRSQWHADTREEKIGYFKRQSHDVVEAETCPILLPELDAELKGLRENRVWSKFFSERVNIEAAADTNGNTSVYSEEILEPTRDLDFEVNEDRFSFNAQTFFQGNGFLVEKLVGAATGDSSGDSALDLFCGVGLFSVPLARSFERVSGVESNSISIEFAKRNGEFARLKNLEFFDARVGNYLKQISEEGKNFDFVLLDPPRSGLKKRDLKSIAEIARSEISYVSCNPSTLARDLEGFMQNRYEIKNIEAFDLFPQTHHVETVVRLARIN